MTDKLLNVWWDGLVVGQFTQDRHGDIAFAYAPSWLEGDAPRPLSASLPLRAAPFSRRESRPFFGAYFPRKGSAPPPRRLWEFHPPTTLHFSTV